MLEMLLNDRPTESTTRIAKRIVDLALACALIALTLPLMAIIALAIKLDSPGPVFSCQERLSFGGRRVRILRFRTTVHKPHDAVPIRVHDAHVTRVGRFLRYTRIDDLPQLVNVLRGEMSLVGARR
jgi:lipopolysaccharide/colanic/teichoic acid biosynthesis glycosyltransferase